MEVSKRARNLILFLLDSVINVTILQAQFDSSSFPILSKQEVTEDLDLLLTSIEDIHPAPYRAHPKKAWI
jgi:hypothetical protein